MWCCRVAKSLDYNIDFTFLVSDESILFGDLSLKELLVLPSIVFSAFWSICASVGSRWSRRSLEMFLQSGSTDSEFWRFSYLEPVLYCKLARSSVKHVPAKASTRSGEGSYDPVYSVFSFITFGISNSLWNCTISGSSLFPCTCMVDGLFSKVYVSTVEPYGGAWTLWALFLEWALFGFLNVPAGFRNAPSVGVLMFLFELWVCCFAVELAPKLLLLFDDTYTSKLFLLACAAIFLVSSFEFLKSKLYSFGYNCWYWMLLVVCWAWDSVLDFPPAATASG